MKWLIASDIHGSAYACRLLLERYAAEGADWLLLLGDLLYHGPRNDLPREYAPKQVIALLSSLAGDIFCVRGNCDAEVDQMVLPFSIRSDSLLLETVGRLVFATHGHLYGEQALPPLHEGDVLLTGHTHVPACREREGIFYLNPGSVSLPKEGSEAGYMTLEDGTFVFKTMQGREYSRFSLPPRTGK